MISFDSRGWWWAIGLALLAVAGSLHAGEFILTAPLDYQVSQRETRDQGPLAIEGKLEGVPVAEIEARLVIAGKAGEWGKVPVTFTEGAFAGRLTAPAGGWYRLEVRARRGGGTLGESAVEHVGIGEVFVVAGQSNSANYGSEKQTSTTGRVATFTGQAWQIASDPQPGAGGEGGSFMPPFGDALVAKFQVPVGFIACGVGSTSVRHWLPRGGRSPRPPTHATSNLPGGEWESDGGLFDRFIARMKRQGPHGFRAVLWHQGESDANQQDPACTLPGPLYREYLEKVIRESRREIGWDAPWFVAQVSYHVPGDEASPDIRAAQAALWKEGIAREGPDTDALKGGLREANGQGVHFSGPGLREHAARWVEKVAPWLAEETR